MNASSTVFLGGILSSEAERFGQLEEDPLVQSALNAMGAEQLRWLIRQALPRLDAVNQAYLKNEIVVRAAKGTNGWSPSSPGEQRVRDIEAFAAAAQRVHEATPSQVDQCLGEGTQAFLARDYSAAARIFRVLLVPLGNADIYLGEEETIDDVLGVDVYECARQHMVAAYMMSSAQDRPRAVLAAMEELDGLAGLWAPIRALEETKVEELPGFGDFLTQWHSLIEARFSNTGNARKERNWLREAVLRVSGIEGLGELAQRDRDSEDLEAWCRGLAESGDWQGARTAFEKAVELSEDCCYTRAEFMDGVALAAQELGTPDLDTVLEQAWRIAPNLTRLRRWLGCGGTRKLLLERTASALEAVPTEASRQRAFLHALRGEWEEVAELLAMADGLGWSGEDHPGYLVFPIFVGLLRSASIEVSLPLSIHDMGNLWGGELPQLSTPTIDDLIGLAGVNKEQPPKLRLRLVGAMRVAAEKRLQGVTKKKRRRVYAHAASIAVLCAETDSSVEGWGWLDELMDSYRRYPALMRAFDAAL